LLSPSDILTAIFQLRFIVYVAISGIILFILLSLSNSPQSGQYIYIDLVIAALFGGFTVLCTKSLSSLLHLGLVILKYPLTHFLVIGLVTTAVLQIRFLNKSLSNFESMKVLPTNFVLFTTSSIVASTILFDDMARTSPFAFVGTIVC
jgi:hypothetical protein